jgi:hypothetical protein
MAPIVFYVPIASVALAGIWAIIGPIDDKLDEKCENRCRRIKDNARPTHTKSKWSLDDILDVCEISWEIREIRDSADRAVIRVTWIMFALLGSSIAGLIFSLFQNLAIFPLGEELIVYIDLVTAGFFVVLLPFLWKLIKRLFRKTI